MFLEIERDSCYLKSSGALGEEMDSLWQISFISFNCILLLEVLIIGLETRRPSSKN